MFGSSPLSIGRRQVGAGQPAYLIAEIGSNHDQSKDRALDMIAAAAAAGADAVKFQSIRFDRLYRPRHETAAFRDWFRQIELNEEWYSDLAAAAMQAGTHFLSSPTYPEAVDLLQRCGVPAYKLASPQVQADDRVIRAAARTGKPIIMSSGYTTEPELERAIAISNEENNDQVVVLHCVSHYPMKPAESHLRYLPRLAGLTGCPVGFSDHSLGPHLAVAAVTLGACMIEKHVTNDRKNPGPDHHFAMTFGEFADMARQIREVESALSDATPGPLSEDVLRLRDAVGLKIFSRNPIRAGQMIERRDLDFFRATASGLARQESHHVVGAIAVADIPADTPITKKMIKRPQETS